MSFYTVKTNTEIVTNLKKKIGVYYYLMWTEEYSKHAASKNGFVHLG